MNVGGRTLRSLIVTCGLVLIAHNGDCQSLIISGGFLQFMANADSLSLAPQFVDLSVVALGGENVPFKFAGLSHFAGLSPGVSDFLVVSPPTGVTPAVVLVGLNPNVIPYMPAGRYREFMWFAKPGETCGSTPPCASTTVELTVIRRPPPTISHVANAATLQPGPLAPGQVVSIFGEYLGTPPVSSQFDSGGLYPTTLGNSTVAFNGEPGALLYVSTNQINAVVPWAVAGEKSVEIVVNHDGANAPPVSAPLAETAPGIFTASGNGRGQGAIINNGVSFNNAENPAPKGSVITMFGTGGGLWTESFPEGSIYLGGPARAKLAAPVSVTIGGRPAAIQYAGGAPYQVAGMFQINAKVPLDIGSGQQSLVVTVGQNDNALQQVTVAVQ